MIRFNHADITRTREHLLADGCKGLAKSLMQIDPGKFFLFFKSGEFPEVYENVGSMIDQHFAFGTVAFACTGNARLDWNEAPSVGIDLEFFCEGVFAFFRLNIAQDYAAVEIHHVIFQDSSDNSEANTDSLRQAINAAGSAARR